MTWDEFHARLQGTLRRVTDRCVLIVSTPGAGGYLQFIGVEDTLVAEASGPAFAAGAAAHAADDPTMLTAGWVPPTRPRPNWVFDLATPALTSEYVALADRCVIALRDVFGLPDPSVLGYRAWREPEQQRPGLTWPPERVDELDRGEDPLPLPELGLRALSA